MIKVKLYNCIPTKNIEVEKLSITGYIFRDSYIKAGTLLYHLSYKNDYDNKKFSVEIRARYEGFYVFNRNIKNNARWYNWGYIKEEPILYEIWESEKEHLRNKKNVNETFDIGPTYSPTPITNTSHNLVTSSTNKEDKKDKSCHTYLMYDNNTGFYKIGMANDPTYRERTLQSEKPTIELIACKKFPERQEARNLEKTLHNKFDKKRKRGEWFKLEDNDVNYIKGILQNN